MRLTRSFGKEIEARGDYKHTVEKAHSQIEHRAYWQTDDISWITGRSSWEGLTSIGFEPSTMKKSGKTAVSWRYFISSLPTDIDLFAEAVRGHWRIEAMHNVWGATLKEDENQTLERTAVENLSTVRKWIYSILRHLDIGEKNASMRLKRYYVSQKPRAAINLLVKASN